MPLKTQQDDAPVLNLTPMIDILFLLIIFFMVGSKFTEMERSVDLDVPQVSDVGALTSAPEMKVINVFNDGRVMLGTREIELADLKTELAASLAEYQDLGVLVRGDSEVPFQQVATVLTTVRQAGIAEMAISVRLTNQRR
ncbi:ExbD/TolR family protein [Blastopirellula marina]|uniref:Biopolymer transporter ExbD n=1 Tax=Blastopirellula marina TaxID=124 RepID=A0A2S8GLM0_9BACT|nr:biopolymer transporter ExbD [Blastopirellula marina]PQO45325.1 biopolymer transporter ExbD [Blastopirellula marina]